MKKLNILLIVLLLISISFSSCKEDKEEAPPEVSFIPDGGNVPCYARKKIFENNSQKNVQILISAKDNCHGLALEIVDSNNRRISIISVADSQKINKLDNIPSGATVFLDCYGVEGDGCEYSILPQGFIDLIEDEVACATSTEIFRNDTQNTVEITLSAEDNCTTALSSIELWDGFGNRLEPIQLFKDNGKFPDKTIAVPSGFKVLLICEGLLELKTDCCAYAFSIGV